MGSGALATSLNVKYLNTLTNLCIVRAARDNYQLALAAASLVRTIKGRAVALTCRHMAGTIRSCQEAAIRINKEVLARLSLQHLGGAGVMMAPSLSASSASPSASASSSASASASASVPALSGSALSGSAAAAASAASAASGAPPLSAAAHARLHAALRSDAVAGDEEAVMKLAD